MTPKELYDHIVKNMTPEQALLKLLESSLIKYEKLKFEKDCEVHPIFIITAACIDLGWSIAVEDRERQQEVRGMTIGTDEYLEEVLKK